MSDLVYKFYSSGDALEAVKAVFAQSNFIRISTAYFEIQGYHLLADVLDRKQIKLLVGREQGAKDRLETVLSEFVDSLSMGNQRGRTRAMQQMLKSLEKGQLMVQVGDDPNDSTSVIEGKYLYQHAKLYIGDDFAVVVTSANLSFHGLKRSRESGVTNTNAEDVEFFINKFETYFSKAQEITQLFIEKLLACLHAYDPYIIYARALLDLYRLPEDEVPPQSSDPTPKRNQV